MSLDNNEWVEQMLELVSLARPELSDTDRDIQRQSLLHFRTFEFNRIKPSFSQKWKRGILFEALIRSHPGYQGRNSNEWRVGRYLENALRFDYFSLSPGVLSTQSHPDDIIVSVDENGVASVVALVEVKLAPFHPKVVEQLPKLETNLARVIETVDLYLLYGTPLPARHQPHWPTKVISIILPEDYEKVLFVPANAGTPQAYDWQLVESSFSFEEVITIADYLWELDRD